MAHRIEHPRVIQPLEAPQTTSDEKYIFYPLRLMKSNLRQLLGSPGRKLDPQTAAEYVSELADILIAVYPKLIHQDLKPENILVDEHGNLYLSDFGYGLPNEDRHKAQSRRNAAGTRAYMAPEVLEKHFHKELRISLPQTSPEPRQDIYSMGVIFYELLTGQPLCGEDGEARLGNLYQPPAVPNALDPAIPIDLSKICERCLAVELKDRISSAAELSELLAPYASEKRYLRRLIQDIELEASLYSPLRGVEKRVARKPLHPALRPWAGERGIGVIRYTARGKDRLNHETRVETREYSDVLEAYPAVKRAALLGAPGSGKSTTLRRLALQLANTALQDRQAPIPLLVPLRDWTSSAKLVEYIASKAGDIGLDWTALACRRPVALLLDGLNEIPTTGRKEKADELRSLCETYDAFGVPLQLGEIVERIGAVEFAGVDQAHEQVAHGGAVHRLIEQ